MQGKTCLITGANAGIGAATALLLAEQGANLIIHARNYIKAETIKERLQSKFTSIKIESVFADFSSLQEVRQMAMDVQEKHNSIDVLINNAGMMTGTFMLTKEGFEMQFGVNHLAPFLLTNLLLPQLKAAHGARIVNVSSGAHTRASEDFAGWQNWGNKYDGWQAYCNSKLANILFTYELARRKEFTGITANCLHPGMVSTDIGQKNNNWLRWVWRMMRPFMSSPQTGASTSVYLATSPEMDQITGQYYSNSTSKPSSIMSYDQDLAKKLWKQSRELVSENN